MDKAVVDVTNSTAVNHLTDVAVNMAIRPDVAVDDATVAGAPANAAGTTAATMTPRAATTTVARKSTRTTR